MRTRNALTRLAAAAPTAAPDLASGEEDRILAQVLAAPRQANRRPRLTLALVGVAVVGAAAIAASLELGKSNHSAVYAPGRVALTGARIELAGYHFRTPAGFKEATSSCGPASDFNGFAAAASADGGCLEAFVMFSSHGSAVPAGADPVTVGAYQGYFVSAGASQRASLYVVLPALGGFVKWQALVLDARGLTEDQLVAVAESGLPQNPQAASTIGPT